MREALICWIVFYVERVSYRFSVYGGNRAGFSVYGGSTKMPSHPGGHSLPLPLYVFQFLRHVENQIAEASKVVQKSLPGDDCYPSPHIFPTSEICVIQDMVKD